MSDILVVRSWPKELPEYEHARVIDNIPRAYHRDDYRHLGKFDYHHLIDLGRDVINLDWDMAVSPEQLQLFSQYANEDRSHCLVAPYLLYPGGRWGKTIRTGIQPTWAVYRWDQLPRNCTETQMTCHYFGFGMVYLPYTQLKAWDIDNPERYMDDGAFSKWYYTKVGETRITWDIRPIHLNFPRIEEI